MTDRHRKLAEMDRLTYGVRHGMGAFDDRLEEMGPGISARGTGGSGKGSASDPTLGQVLRPARVVSSNVDRLIDRAHAAVLDLEQAYREIAQPVKGLPAQGKPNCAWCESAAKAKDSPVPDHRCDTYLFAKVTRGGTTSKALVCRWCYRFSMSNDRPPTIRELWLHAQGRRVLVQFFRKPGDKRAKAS